MAISASCLIAMSGCEDDMKNDLTATDAFRFNPEDTTLTAASHDLTFSIVADEGSLPDDWKLAGVSLHDPSKNEGEGIDNLQWVIMTDGMTLNGVTCDIVSEDSISLGWVTMKKIADPVCPRLRVHVAENADTISRAVRIGILQHITNSLFSSAELVITQKACPDTAPFEMKIRYKGQIHKSQAHIDINENIVFEDKSFAAIMTEINSKDDIETFILNEDIVDYMDYEDLKKRPELQRISEKVEHPELVPLRNDILFTRANEMAFIPMDKNGLGYFIMCDDTDFYDTCKYGDLYDLIGAHDIVNLEGVGLNDKVSSLAIAYNGDSADVCAVLTVWEDSWFNFDDEIRAKHKMTVVASKFNPRLAIPNLKKVSCKGSSKSWNDRISSSSFHFGHYGTYPKDN